ncbi:MAG: hypothetical protein ABIG11_08115 [bacterium]
MADIAAAGYRKIYPSFTIVHSSPCDFTGAYKKNVKEAGYAEGLFRISSSSAPNIPKQSRGTIESVPVKARYAFTELIMSANAFLPHGTAFSLEVRVRVTGCRASGEGSWSGWYKLGRFTPDGKSESFPSQEDETACVETDVLKIKKNGRRIPLQGCDGIVGKEQPGPKACFRCVYRYPLSL